MARKELRREKDRAERTPPREEMKGGPWMRKVVESKKRNGVAAEGGWIMVNRLEIAQSSTGLLRRGNRGGKSRHVALEDASTFSRLEASRQSWTSCAFSFVTIFSALRFSFAARHKQRRAQSEDGGKKVAERCR